ncbi:MAG TPA: metallophosphoesterase [Nevskiaceae bacterium]|nr:metallophosphoesterase [Nevskiaceae bacterium]
MKTRPVRLNVLSDLHLSRGELPHPHTDADIVILAGDLGRPEQAMAWARGFARPVLFVPGNHEYYGGGIRTTDDQLRALTAGSSVHVLQQDECVLAGVRFLGATLWTGFQVDREVEARVKAMAACAALMRDFKTVASAEKPGGIYSPEESTHVFARHRAWLAERLAIPFEGPTVVVTHHAPSWASIHPRFAGSPYNNAFVSDLEDLMGARRVALWIHGHTHDSFDYVVHGTRVLCNPRGYLKDGANENGAFDPELVVSV